MYEVCETCVKFHEVVRRDSQATQVGSRGWGEGEIEFTSLLCLEVVKEHEFLLESYRVFEISHQGNLVRVSREVFYSLTDTHAAATVTVLATRNLTEAIDSAVVGCHQRTLTLDGDALESVVSQAF